MGKKSLIRNSLMTYTDFYLCINFRIRNTKPVTELTHSQIFTFIVDTQSKKKSEKIELETYFYKNFESLIRLLA